MPTPLQPLAAQRVPTAADRDALLPQRSEVDGAQYTAALDLVAEAAELSLASLQRRNAAIIAASAAGASLRSIAASAGMSHAGVAKVLSRGA